MDYQKPKLNIMSSQWARWCKDAQEANQALLNLPWGKVNHKQTLSKGAVMEAPIDDVWNVVSDWQKTESIIPGTVDMKVTGKTTYDITFETYNKSEGWQHTLWHSEILECSPYIRKQRYWTDNPRPLGDYSGFIEWRLEKVDGGTMVWLIHEYDKMLSNTEKEEQHQANFLGEVYKLVVGDNKFNQIVNSNIGNLPKSRLV